MTTAAEPPLDPAQPIIDPHLHLWQIGADPAGLQEPQSFLLPEALHAIETSGHAITHSVFVECHAMYRCEGPPEARSLGETEFANGIAAMAASGGYGPVRLAHRIVANVDLMLGEAVGPVLDAHRAAAGERLVGVRNTTSYRAAGLFGGTCDPLGAERLGHARFRSGAAVLAASGLSLDVWCLAPQLPDLIALADAVPDLVIVLDHVGTPEIAPVGTSDGEGFARWRTDIGRLAERANVRIKLGGLGMDIDRPIGAGIGDATSAALAETWRPWIETCIEAFTPDRAMFESNFPPDGATADYGTIWNAFKRIAAGASAAERDRLFRRTAAATYRIALPVA